MEFDVYLRFVFALILVLGLIALLAWILRRSGFGGVSRHRAGKRLQVLETAVLPPKHRLVLVRRDGVEHLLLLGPSGDLLVESGIRRSERQEPRFGSLLAEADKKSIEPETGA